MRISQSGQNMFFILSSLTFKDFVMLVTFLPFQSNLHVVLAREKGPKNSFHGDLFETKIPKQKSPRHPAMFYAPYDAWIGLQPNP